MSGFGNEDPDLYDVLINLGIETGKIGRNEIRAWYDTDSQDTLDFLTWFKSFVNESNTVSALDHKRYQSLKDDGLTLQDEALEDAVKEAESKWPGIFDLEANLGEKERLQDSTALIEDESKQLDQLILTNKELNTKLQNLLSDVTEAEADAKTRQDQASQNCLLLSNRLDEANRNLETQVTKHRDKLVNLDSSFMFSRNVNSADCDRLHGKVHTDVSCLIKREIKLLPTLEDVLNSGKKKLNETMFNTVSTDELLNDLPNRIANSELKNIFAKAEQDTLESTLNYLNAPNISDLILKDNTSSQSYIILMLKEEQLKAITSELKTEAMDIAQNIISTLQMHNAKNEIKYISEKLKFLSTAQSKLDETMANFLIPIITMDAEISDIRSTKKFIQELRQYIISDLRKCAMRKNVMAEEIDKYEAYKLQPFETKYKLIKNMLSIITGSEQNFNMQEALKHVHGFLSEYRSLRHKKFFKVVDDFKNIISPLESDMKVLKSFLSGPTKELVCIPNVLYWTFNEITDVLRKNENELKHCMTTYSEVEKKIKSDKWFCLRRQLWMYFLVEPKKLPFFIQSIENECRLRTKTSYM